MLGNANACLVMMSKQVVRICFLGLGSLICGPREGVKMVYSGIQCGRSQMKELVNEQMGIEWRISDWNKRD